MILLEVDKGLEIGFYSNVLPLSVAISFQIEGDRKSMLNLIEVAKQSLEF